MPKSEYKHWFINEGKEHLALDYKVKMNAKNTHIDNKEIQSRDRIPNFFANMGKEFKENPKGFSFGNSTINVEIICFNSNLKKNICDNLPLLFAVTNFGTRQNKGFGSFYLDSKSDCYRKIEDVLKGYYYFEIRTIDKNIIYKVIEYYYKRLKAGINDNFNRLCTKEPNCDPKKYKKSYLFNYFNSTTKNGWEKRWIKETFFGLDNDEKGKFFIRALLGLSGSYSYRPTTEPCHKKNDEKISPNYKIRDEYEIEVKHSEIDRFKSPITFKPIINGNSSLVYIIPNKTYSLILKHQHIPFKFHKKFVITEMFINNRGEIIIKPGKAIPSIEGTRNRDIENVISKLNRQENLIDKYIDRLDGLIENERDNRHKGRLKDIKCKIEKIITGQKERFEAFLDSCTTRAEKYYPPYEEISLPNGFDINELIESYNQKELNNSFSIDIDGRTNKVLIKK